MSDDKRDVPIELQATMAAGPARPESHGDSGASRRSRQGDDKVDSLDVTLAQTFDRAQSMTGILEGDIEPGTSLGRYIVLRCIGEGGMGSVYAAFDPVLDRQIALKVVRATGFETKQAGQTRLLREAQAIARLSHPNIVTVYDVGLVGDAVFMAMELIQGQTLRDWMDEARPWREVIDVFIRAGRGLAAAHSAGLVHRDFKPENVFIASDGRVRVLDFGLVAPVGSDHERSDNLASKEEIGASTEKLRRSQTKLGDPLTVTGALLGTPAYMSPEQHLGRPVDARTDQYSFCIALYQALFGRYPFSRTIEELLPDKLAERIADPPSEIKVPSGLMDILRRGLKSNPHERWPSMDVLLTELDSHLRKGRTRWLAAVAVLVALIATAGLTRLFAMPPPPVSVCAGAERALSNVWGSHRKAALERVVLAVGTSEARAAWERLKQRLDTFAVEWVTMHEDNCEATQVRHQQPVDIMMRREQCLDHRLIEVDAALSLLAADARELQAAELVRFTALSHCANTQALLAEAPLPGDPKTATEVARLRKTLADITTKERLRHYSEALQLAEKMAKDAQKLTYAPVLAEALLAQGRQHMHLGAYSAAEQILKEAYWLAQRSDYDRLATQAGAALAQTVGVYEARFDEAELWGLHAQAALSRSGIRGEYEAELLQTLAAVYLRAGRTEEALSLSQRALAIRIEVFGDQDLIVAESRLALSEIQRHRQLYDLADKEAAQALAIRNNRLDRAHPLVADVIHSQASIARDRAQNRDDYARALALYEQALESYREDEKTAAHAALLYDAGLAYAAVADHEKARASYNLALDIFRNLYGDNHLDVALTLRGIGDVLWHSGRHKEALDHHERAADILDRVVADHPELISALTSLARDYISLSQPERAMEPLRRAIRIAQSREYERRGLADGYFLMAQVMWSRRAERAQAVEMAKRARALYVSLGVPEERVREVDAWLKQRG